MDALPGAVVQAFAHLWGRYPEVAAGIYAAGAIAAAVPNYMPSFDQAKVWYQKPRQSTRSVAKPAHATEDAADIVKSIVTKARRPVLITITSSVSPACNTLLTVEQQVKVKVLDTSSSSESTQDTSESATECSARSTASSSSQVSSECSTPRDMSPEISSKITERSLAKTTSTSSEPVTSLPFDELLPPYTVSDEPTKDSSQWFARRNRDQNSVAQNSRSTPTDHPASNAVHEVQSALDIETSLITNTGFKAWMTRFLHVSRSFAPSKESTTSDASRAVTSTGSLSSGREPSRITSPVVVEQLPVTLGSSSEINDYSFETITIPLRSKTVSSAPPSSTGSGDSGLKEHKSAFTHYRQKAAGTSLQDPPVFKIPSGVPLFSTQNRASTLREHEPAFTDYTQQTPSKPVRDSPPSAKSQRSLWKDFRRAIHEEYVTQQADQKPTKPSYYTSPITMEDVMVGYVPSVLFTVCDHLYKDDPDLQEMVGFIVRNAYAFVVGYLTYAEFRLPTLPYSEPVAYARSIGSVSYNVWQKAVADLLGKQQTDHLIIDRALYATLIGIAIYFLLFAGRRTREVVHHEQDESDLSEDEDMCETQDLPLRAPAVIPHQKETFIRSCIGFTVVMTAIWLSVYVQDLAVVFVSALAVYVLSIYGKEARKIIFTILNLVVGGFYRSVIAAQNWIQYYAVVAVVVYLFTHEERLSLCAGRIFRGVTPPFSHFVVVLKLIGLSYVDLLVRGIIDVSRICIAKFRVVKAWAQYKFMLIVRGHAVFPWHPKTVGGFLRWVLATIILGVRTMFGLLPAQAGPVFTGIVMLIVLWALTFAFIPLFISLFTAIWHTIQPWIERTSDATAHTVKESRTRTTTTTTALRDWVTLSHKLTTISRERATSSCMYTATSTERATSSRTHTTLSSAWATKSVRNASSSFITTIQETASLTFEKISMNLSLLYKAQIEPVVSSVGVRCLNNWCQGLAYHWVWRATTIIALTSVCTVGWIVAAQAYPAHRVLSSFAFATTFMMMYVLGTNGVLACTQDYGVIFVTIFVILLLLSHWRPGPIMAQNTPDEPLLKLPDEVVAPGSAPPSPPSAQIPAPTSGIGESEQRNPLGGGPGTINQPPDAQPAQAPQPPSDSQAVDLLDEDLSWLPDEVDALRTQQQASPVQAPVRTPTLEQSTEPPAQAQIEPQTPTADAWTQTDAPLSWPQRWMSWLFDSQVARTARGKTLEIARAAAEQEHKDFLEQCGLASGVEHEKKLKDTNAETKETQSPNEDSASPAADSSMTFQPIGTEQQHRATVEAEKPEEAMPVIPSETATEAISGSTAQVPAIPVVAADTSASVRTLTPAATFKRTPLFAPALTTTTPATTASLPPVAPATPTPRATTTPSSIATPATPAISSGSLTVPTPVTTPTDIPKSAANTTEPSATLDITFDLPTIVINLPEPETQGEYTPMTYIPIEVTELAIPAKYTALTSDAYRETEHTPLVSSSPSISGSRFQDVEPSLGYKSSQDKRELTDKLANLGGQNATNAPDHQAPAAGLVQDQQDDDGKYHEHDGVHESDEEEEQDESEEEFDYGGASPTMGTSAPLQPASPVNAEIAAALQRYRDELQREAEQKKAMTSMNVASDGAPAPGDGDDNNRDNGDAKDHDDADNTPIPGAQTHDTPKPKKEPSSPTDVSMGGIDDDVQEATPTAKANPTVTGLLSHPAPSTTKPRPWAPFSSLPSYRNEPPMFTEDEISSQFALPAIYNRPAARPTDPTHPDSAEQWRNRLLGGPSMLTVMRREREAAARRASGDGSDPPHGPGSPFGGNGGVGHGDGGGIDGSPTPFDPSNGGGGANPPSPSGSAGSGPMEGVDESSSSDEEHHGESDPHSHNNDDGQTTNNQAHTNDQTDNANNGNESDRDNDGDPSAQPGASNLADIPITTPSTLDATVTTDDNGDVDMSDLFNVDLDYIANAGFDDQQTPSTTTDDIWRQLVPAEGLEQHDGIPTSLDLFFEDTEYGEIATQNIFADIDAYEAQNGPIKTSDPMFEPPQYPTNGESLDDLLGNAGDEYSLPNLQPSIIVPGPPNDARDAFDPFSDANWGAEFGDATQAEQDDDVSYQGFIRAAAANAFGEDQEPARHDLAPPPPTHGDHFKLENYGVIEGHEELPAGLANFDLNSNQTGNNAKALFPPKSGAQRIWDSDFNKAPDNAEHEYKHPDEFTNVRPRTRLVQLWEDHKIVENPEHAEYRSAGMKSLDELTGRQGQVFREVPVDTYEMRGESHDDYKDAQELMSWFDPDAEGAEPRGDPSPAGSDDGSALSDETNDDKLDTLANEVAKDQLNELNKAIKRAARDVSDDSDSEVPQKTPDGPATFQKESSGPRAGTQKKGRFQGPVSFDTEEEARFEKNDVEKVMELPIWQKLREAKATSTIPSPVQPSPVANPGLPTRPPTQSTLPTPSMPSSNPTSPSSHYRPPPPSQPYAKLPGSPLPYNPAIPGGFSLGGYQRSYNPATLHKMNGTSPYAGIPSFGKPITPHGNAISPTRKPGYQSMKLPDAGSSNSGNSPMLSPACHPTQPTAGTATRNPPITLPAYNPMWAPVGMTSSNSSTTTPSYDPTQPAAGYTARSASSFRPQLLPIPGLSIPQMSLPQLSAITQQGRPAAQDEDAAGDQTSQSPGDDNKNDYSSDVDSIDGHHEKKPQEYYQQQQWGNAAQTSASASEAPPAAVNNEPVLDDEDANMGGCSPPMDKDSPS